jgi:uncharacterized membrane protein YgdD (TMEM256/DUF423 family)
MTTSTQRPRFALVAAGFLGLTGVACGALGAHGLAERLTAAGTLHGWETAARYHLIHAVAVFAASVWLRTTAIGAGRIQWAVRCWAVGVVLFSGSIYGLALGGPRWLGPVTPIGGVTLMAGWLCVLVAAFAREE